MIYIIDVEVYPNLFIASVKDIETGEYIDYEVSERRSDHEALKALLSAPDNGFVGFNLENYDNHILLLFLLRKTPTTEEIYKESQNIIGSKFIGKASVPYAYIDLYKINNYDNNAKRTSLKWLEFSMRTKKMQDLPYPFNKKLTVNQYDDVIKYCHNDLNVTEEFYKTNSKAIQVRKELAAANNSKLWLNYSEPIIGREIMLSELSKKKGEPKEYLSKLRTPRKVIHVKDIISPKVKFVSPEFQGALNYFKNMTVHAQKDGEMVLKGSCDYNLKYGGVDLAYGVGGLHGANVPGVYISDEHHTIIDSDFTSFYPNIAISQDIYPLHLGKEFCEVWADIFTKRATYDKSDIRNYIYKIVLNSVFGQMQSKYTPFYDPQAFLAITVNGQLIISMLTELMSRYGTLIQVNTDGVTAKIPNTVIEELKSRLDKFAQFIGINLEHSFYDVMIMRDVNNYIAVSEGGKVKRKGMFEQYEDFVAGGTYHKNPSALIIPKAIEDYFLKQTSVEQTIQEETNIHQFLYGLKKQSNFVHCLWKWDDAKGAVPQRYDERALRFYMSNNGGTLVKHFTDMRLISVSNAKRVNVALNIRNEDTSRFPDLNREYYVVEAKKWIDLMKNIY